MGFNEYNNLVNDAAGKLMNKAYDGYDDAQFARSNLIVALCIDSANGDLIPMSFVEPKSAVEEISGKNKKKQKQKQKQKIVSSGNEDAIIMDVWATMKAETAKAEDKAKALNSLYDPSIQFWQNAKKNLQNEKGPDGAAVKRAQRRVSNALYIVRHWATELPLDERCDVFTHVGDAACTEEIKAFLALGPRGQEENPTDNAEDMLAAAIESMDYRSEGGTYRHDTMHAQFRLLRIFYDVIHADTVNIVRLSTSLNWCAEDTAVEALARVVPTLPQPCSVTAVDFAAYAKMGRPIGRCAICKHVFGPLLEYAVRKATSTAATV
jgi:hypothetical protein